MFLLILGLFLFLAVHSIVIFAPNFRAKYRNQSPLLWKTIYGLCSIIGFILIIIGYGQARLSPIVIYMPPMWLKYIATISLIPVFIFFLAPYFPGKISKITRHPQLMAVKLFMMAHLIANGTLADILLFGLFLAWAVLDLIALNRLPKENPANSPLKLPAYKYNDAILVVLGLALYFAFIYVLHYKLIGIGVL